MMSKKININMKKPLPMLTTSRALIMLWMSHCLVDVMIGFWSVYKTIAHLDLAIAGLIAGLSPFIGEGMQVVFGTLGDRGYRKALLIFGLGACAASSLLPYTNNYYLLFVIYLITCIGSGAFHPSAAAVASSITQHRKGLFVSIFASGGAIGMAISHMTFTLWHTHFNGHTLMLILPILLVIGLISFINLPGNAPQAIGLKKFKFTEMFQLFRYPELTTLYISQVCNQAIFWGVIFLLPDVLVSKGYESWISFGGGHFFFIIGGAAMMIPAGMLSDRYSPKVVLFFAAFVGLLLFYTLLLTPLLSDFAILPLLFALGSALGVCSPVAIAFGNKMLPSRPGLVSAFLMGLAWCISESIGPGGGGLLTKCFEDNAPVKALTCFGFLFVGGMLATAFLPSGVAEEIEIQHV